MATGWPMKTNYANGDVWSASDANDITGTINLAGGAQWAAGKNKFINADFRFNQRAFTSTTVDGTYGFDRWYISNVGGTTTYSAQTFTPGTAPVAGYEAINFARVVTSSQTLSNHYAFLGQRIEDARTFAGQTVTISFWAKAASGTPSVGVTWYRNYGTGGSPSAAEYAVSAGQKTAITTSWARYSLTFAINSVSGKTFGTNANTSSITPFLWTSAGSDYNTQSGSLGLQNVTIDFWGIQVEQGSTATPFQTATGTIQGELAACQRYYWRAGYDNSNQRFGTGAWNNPIPNRALVFMTNPVVMRTAPSSTIDYANLGVFDNNSTFAVTSLTMDAAGAYGSNLNCYTASGSVAYRPVQLVANGSTSAYIGFSAEL